MTSSRLQSKRSKENLNVIFLVPCSHLHVAAFFFFPVLHMVQLDARSQWLRQLRRPPLGALLAGLRRSRLSYTLPWHSGLPRRGLHTPSCTKTGTVSHVPSRGTPAARWKSSRVKPTWGSSEERRRGRTPEFSTDSRRVPGWRTLEVKSEDKWELPRWRGRESKQGEGGKRNEKLQRSSRNTNASC